MTLGKCSFTCVSITRQYNLIVAKGWWCSLAGKAVCLTASNGSQWLKWTGAAGRTVDQGMTAATWKWGLARGVPSTWGGEVWGDEIVQSFINVHFSAFQMPIKTCQCDTQFESWLHAYNLTSCSPNSGDNSFCHLFVSNTATALLIWCCFTSKRLALMESYSVW